MKVFFRMVIGAIISFVLAIFLCNALIDLYSSKRVYNDAQDIPENKVGLVLGTSNLLSNGSPNMFFVYRIEAAAELYNADKIRYLIVSGDNHKASYNEPEEMKSALIQKGIPEHVIYEDYAGFRTLDSMVRAKEIFGQHKLTVISQKFHNERAIYLANHFGIDAVGYNARDVEAGAGFKTRVREYFARVKVFVDMFFHKQPKFLGKPVHIG